MQVCDDPLRCLKINDQGQFIAVGSDMGTVYLVEISDNLVDLQKNDKPLLTAVSGCITFSSKFRSYHSQKCLNGEAWIENVILNILIYCSYLRLHFIPLQVLIN